MYKGMKSSHTLQNQHDSKSEAQISPAAEELSSDNAYSGGGHMLEQHLPHGTMPFQRETVNGGSSWDAENRRETSDLYPNDKYVNVILYRHRLQ